MPVYVDPLMTHGGSPTFPWKQSCHLFVDTIEELHTFAASIGMRRSWFQDKRLKHYDLTSGRRRVAVFKGAIELDRESTVAKWIELGATQARSK